MTALLFLATLFLQDPAPRPVSPTIVAGQVKFADGEPAPTLTIAAIPVSETSRQANQRVGGTSDSGAFRIFNVQPGRYYIRAAYSSSSYIYYPGVTSEAAATPIDVVAGTNPDPLEFVLPPSASGVSVLGRVRIPSGQTLALENQRVELRARPFGALPPVPISLDGGFALAHMRPGSYLLSVPAPGFEPVTVNVGSDDISGVELNVPKLIRVSGNLTMNGNVSRPRFAIKFDSPAYQTSVPVQDGSFSAQLPAGTYHLVVSGLPAGYYLSSLRDGANDLFVKPLKVAADESVSVAVTLALSNGVRIKGRIDGANAEADTSFARKLLLDGAAVDELAQTRVNADGTFEFAKLTPGTYVARMTISAVLTSSPIPLLIPNSNVDDLRIPIPEPKEVFGRVTVDGFGPPPKFTLLLSGSDNQTLQVSVSALPDGTFRMKLPQGKYRLASNGVPVPYVLQSLSYGPADLTREPLQITDKDNAELIASFGTAQPNPWVRVSGRVKGTDPARGPYRVALDSNTTSAIEAPVHPDGSFEFQTVLQRNNYTAKLMPANDAATSPRVIVADKDLPGVEIIVPGDREISGLAVLDGSRAPVPAFMLTFSTTGSTFSAVVKPETSGTFRVHVPDDSRRVALRGLPIGYSVKSMTYGGADLLKQPLQVADGGELRVTLAADSDVKTGNISGRVSGLDPNSSYRMQLEGISSYAILETAIDRNGGFNLSDVPQGAYVLSILGGSSAYQLTPTSIEVAGTDQSGLEISALRTVRLDRSRLDGGSTGARVTEAGGSRGLVNNSSVVARARTLLTAEVAYLSKSGGKFGTIPQLIAAGFLDKSFIGVVDGFMYSVIVVGKEYVIAGIPAIPEPGVYAFYSTADGVIRYSTSDFLSPVGQNGSVVQ